MVPALLLELLPNRSCHLCLPLATYCLYVPCLPNGFQKRVRIDSIYKRLIKLRECTRMTTFRNTAITQRVCRSTMP